MYFQLFYWCLWAGWDSWF